MRMMAYYRIEAPKTWRTRRLPPLKVLAGSFRGCEPDIRRELWLNQAKFVDVLKLKRDGTPSTFARRYFTDMSYKSI